jgi:hypothetical protein
LNVLSTYARSTARHASRNSSWFSVMAAHDGASAAAATAPASARRAARHAAAAWAAAGWRDGSGGGGGAAAQRAPAPQPRAARCGAVRTLAHSAALGGMPAGRSARVLPS